MADIAATLNHHGESPNVHAFFQTLGTVNDIILTSSNSYNTRKENIPAHGLWKTKTESQ